MYLIYSGLRLHAASCMWSPARKIPCTADRKEKRCDNHPPLHLGSRLLMPCLGCSSRLAVETVQEAEDRLRFAPHVVVFSTLIRPATCDCTRQTPKDDSYRIDGRWRKEVSVQGLPESFLQGRTSKGRDLSCFETSSSVS